jgi:hypothetical protein
VLKNNGFHNRHSPFSRPFSPASFFANGEQGWWYDPSNFATLFQDSAGTTPVTAVEQPVGLQLDLSKGLVLGPELVVNGNFATNLSGWTAAPEWTWDAGEAKGVLSSAGQTLIQTFAALAPGFVEFSYRVVSGSLRCAIRGGDGLYTTLIANVLTGSGTFRAYITQPFDAIQFARSGNGTMFVDNVSVKTLAGNHRFQTTSANRPVVSARVNLLTKTEDFTAGDWQLYLGATKSGTSTATITFPANAVSEVYQSVTIPAASAYIFSAEVRAITPNKKFRFKQYTPPGNVYSSDFTATADWQTFTFTVSMTAAIGNVSIANATTADAGSIEVRYPDLRPTNQGVNLPVYQRVNTSTDYDSTGFPTYIKPNGSNQFMQTNSINFSATDKMTVWQGVRKLSDASIAMVTELSVNNDSNNGSFAFAAPVGANTYYFALRGTALSCRQPTTPINAPVTSVIAINYKLSETSANETTVRVNANAITLSTASGAPGPAGTGNYGNFPAYFYARAGSTFFFNGNDYGSIARGAASTAAQITDGETYINSKTKAYT